MIPSFLVGCTVCELYLVRGQEGGDSQTIQDEEEGKPSWRAYGTLIAEVMLILYVLIVTFAPLDGDFMIHGFTLFWAVAIFLFASCPGWASQGDDDGKGGYSLGLRWLLEADFTTFAGDISLQVYALQRPLRYIIEDPIIPHTLSLHPPFHPPFLSFSCVRRLPRFPIASRVAFFLKPKG